MLPIIMASLSCEHDQRGQGLAEYALILSLIAIAALIFLGNEISSILSTIGVSV